MPSCFPISKSRFAQDVIFEESSAGSIEDPKRILIVMDALKEFCVELLEWVLKNFTFRDCCTITLLGIMPWLNIPLSLKMSDIWSMDLEDLSSIQDKNEFKNDPKYQKVQRLIQLCQNYGVVPEIVTEMGHPIRLLVVEQIGSLHATLVVFDRHHDKKNIEYYAEKIGCDMVVMNDNGDVDLIKKRKLDISNTTSSQPLPVVAEEEEDEEKEEHSASSILAPPCSKSIISEHIKKYLKSKTRGN